MDRLKDKHSDYIRGLLGYVSKGNMVRPNLSDWQIWHLLNKYKRDHLFTDTAPDAYIQIGVFARFMRWWKYTRRLNI